MGTEMTKWSELPRGEKAIAKQIIGSKEITKLKRSRSWPSVRGSKKEVGSLREVVWNRKIITGGVSVPYYIWCNATRFSVVSVIKSKKKAEVVNVFIKHWIAIFGAPSTIPSDNGGEWAI